MKGEELSRKEVEISDKHKEMQRATTERRRLRLSSAQRLEITLRIQSQEGERDEEATHPTPSPKNTEPGGSPAGICELGEGRALLFAGIRELPRRAQPRGPAHGTHPPPPQTPPLDPSQAPGASPRLLNHSGAAGPTPPQGP